MTSFLVCNNTNLLQNTINDNIFVKLILYPEFTSILQLFYVNPIQKRRLARVGPKGRIEGPFFCHLFLGGV